MSRSLEVHGLVAAKRPLDGGEVFISPYRFLGIELFFGHAGTDDVDPIEGRFLGDAGIVALVGERFLGDGELEMLAHLKAIDHLAHRNPIIVGPLGGAGRALSPRRSGPARARWLVATPLVSERALPLPRIAADDQALLWIIGTLDLGEVPLVNSQSEARLPLPTGGWPVPEAR